jgi:peptidoglycan/LPS O-acetylase OafA/YrhL
MRGLAAIVVMLHHFMHMFYPKMQYSTGLLSYLLYPFTAGHESVMFFFILSGFVLALPYLRGKNQRYSLFVRRRVVRIYGPYLCALFLSLIACALWHNQPGHSQPAVWDRNVDLKSTLQQIGFIGNFEFGRYNTAFWSLVYEMRISLIFPLVFLVASRLRAFAAFMVIIVCTFLGVHGSNYEAFGRVTESTLITFEYVGVFMIGVLMAKHLERLCGWYQGLSQVKRICFATASTLLYLGWHVLEPQGALWHLGDIPVAVGAAGLMLVGLNSTVAHKILSAPIPTFCGRISYSLYLVHGTVLFALAALLYERVSPPVILAVFVPTALILSWGFYTAVEAPCMRWSRSLGRGMPTIAGPLVIPADEVIADPTLTAKTL